MRTGLLRIIFVIILAISTGFVQMETFSALLALCEWNLPVTGGFPSQRPVTRSFDIFFNVRLNGWANNRDADDLRRHHANYDVIVMRKVVACSVK